MYYKKLLHVFVMCFFCLVLLFFRIFFRKIFLSFYFIHPEVSKNDKHQKHQSLVMLQGDMIIYLLSEYYFFFGVIRASCVMAKNSVSLSYELTYCDSFYDNVKSHQIFIELWKDIVYEKSCAVFDDSTAGLWPLVLLEIKAELSQRVGIRFNHVVVTKYQKNEHSSLPVSDHRDVGTVLMLTFGASRNMLLHSTRQSEPQSAVSESDLEVGSLICLGPGTSRGHRYSFKGNKDQMLQSNPVGICLTFRATAFEICNSEVSEEVYSASKL